MKRWKAISGHDAGSAASWFTVFLWIQVALTGITSAQETLNFGDLPKESATGKNLLNQNPADPPPLLNSKAGQESLFESSNGGTRKPSWSGILPKTTLPPTPPPELELVPGQGEVASTRSPQRSTPAAQLAPSTKSPASEASKVNIQKVPEIFPPPPFEHGPADNPPASNKPASVIRSEVSQAKAGAVTNIQKQILAPATAPPSPNNGAGIRVPPAAQGVPAHGLVPAAGQKAEPVTATTPVAPSTKDTEDDYHVPPDVFPFTVPSEEIIGKTAELPSLPTIETPKAPPQPFDRSSAYFASNWAPWSAWSQCQNNIKVRVRACNTVVGFTCFGNNKESLLCEIPTTPFPTSPPTLPPFVPIHPNNPDGEQEPVDRAAEFGELPGGPKVFVLSQPPGFGIPAAPPAPAPPPADYNDYSVPEFQPPAPPSPPGRRDRPFLPNSLQAQAKFQQKAEEIDNPEEATEKPKQTAASSKPTTKSKGTTPRPKSTTTSPNSESDPTTEKPKSRSGTKGAKGVKEADNAKKSQILLSKPLDDVTDVTPVAGDISPPADGPLVGGRPPRVRPSGYTPNQPGDHHGFETDTDIAPPGPLNPYGSPAQPPRRGPNVPTGFDQATWGNWAPWGPCTCGKRARTRACDYSTAYLTEGCDGNSYELQPCSGAPCGIEFGGCGPTGCGGGGYGGGGGGCSGGGCVLQGGPPRPPTVGGCLGGSCGGPAPAPSYGEPALVQPPFPYPPVPPSRSSGCPGGECALQGGPLPVAGGCTGTSCGSPGGYPAPAPPPPPAPYGQPTGCSGGDCVLQGGPVSPIGGCTGTSCGSPGGYPAPAPPPPPPPAPYGQPSGCSGGGCVLQGGPSGGILPPIVGGGCPGSGCGTPAGYQPPSPPAGYSGSSGCTGGGCVLQGGTGSSSSSSSGCAGGGCVLQGGTGSSSSGCTGGGCILTGSGGPIMIQPGGSNGYSAPGGCEGGGCGAPPISGCSGGGCGVPSGGYPAPAPPPPPPPPSYGSSGCAGGDCVLQGGPVSSGCSGGGCNPLVPPIAAPAPPPSGYGGGGCTGGGCVLQGGPVSSGCAGGGCSPLVPPIVAPAPPPSGYGGGGCTGGGCGQPSGCSYGTPGCQIPPSNVGAPYKPLPPVETIRMDGVIQPVAFTAPPGVVATAAPAYGAPAPSHSGRLRKDDSPASLKQKPGSLVEADAEEEKSPAERTRRKRRIAIDR